MAANDNRPRVEGHRLTTTWLGGRLPTQLWCFPCVETGASIGFVVQPLLAYDVGGARSVGYISVGTMVGSALCLVWMSRYGDAYRSTIVVRGALLTRVAMTLVMLAITVSGLPIPSVLLGSWAAITGASWSAIAPLQTRAIRGSLDVERWPAALSALRVRSHLADILGVACGGCMYGFARPLPLVVDAMLCMCALLLVQWGGDVVSEVTPRRPDWSVIRVLADTPTLARSVVALVLFSAVSYWPVCVTLGRGVGMSAERLGFMAAGLSLAGIVGALISGYTAVRRNPRGSNALGSLVVVGSLFVFGAAYDQWLGYGFLLIATAAVFPCGLALEIHQAHVTDVGHLGRVMSVLRLAVMVSGTLGQTLGLAFASRGDAMAVFALYASFVAAGGWMLDACLRRQPSTRSPQGLQA